ncbi:hypothetical protein AtNW77_Chr4g0295261 [Arabidopsis thaliana]|uniref:Uncharacterized protein n=3 Tax=Arabidopsis thaliana TaxID=3702 RepID=Q8L8X7_ARATH|nr:uncharacterized protein AT4G19095 [Arabidopsis thaliana]AAM67346.1 unknown [Arabidopsis thaliana]AEE84139.1 hypothetical protein AT4G19095 [Arabidopsis thaliana]CAA0395795.1 unnamed protein product [Arabidopsis thaliana]|eukprot:NP_567573.1 hypothetical protein AT4G19095 [Arabidopsis thaliana]
MVQKPFFLSFYVLFRLSSGRKWIRRRRLTSGSPVTTFLVGRFKGGFSDRKSEENDGKI